MKNREHSLAATNTTEIRNGQSTQVRLDHLVAHGTREVADLRFGASDEYDVQGRLLPGSHIRFVDLRRAEKNAAGASIYEGQLIDPSVAFLAIDPAQIDWKNDIGYKGIRADEDVVLGREAHARRFPQMQDTTSRKHVTVRFDGQSQALLFTDHSLNGTMVTSGRIDPLDAPLYKAEPHEEKPIVPERYVRTLDKQARILDAAYVAQKAVEWGSDRTQPSITHDVLAAKGLDPIVGIGLGDKEFMFSGLIATRDGRLHSLCYADDGNGRVVPHMYYKSNSDGGWRMSPYLYEDGVYNKGDIPLQDRSSGRHVEYGQYTQATKPDESIAALLEEMERMQIGAATSDYTRDIFHSFLKKSSYERSGIDENYFSALSVECVAGYGLDAYVSGKGFKYEPDVARGMLESMRLPVGFTPDFRNKPQRSYQTEHTMLGNTTVEVYVVMYNGKELEWHVATDEASGTVWLDRIAVKGGEVTKYGTRRNLVLAGALNAKPVDYRSQTPNMVEGEDYDMMAGHTYVSMKKTLDRMPWVRDYRRLRSMAMR